MKPPLDVLVGLSTLCHHCRTADHTLGSHPRPGQSSIRLPSGRACEPTRHALTPQRGSHSPDPRTFALTTRERRPPRAGRRRCSSGGTTPDESTPNTTATIRTARNPPPSTLITGDVVTTRRPDCARGGTVRCTPPKGHRPRPHRSSQEGNDRTGTRSPRCSYVAGRIAGPITCSASACWWTTVTTTTHRRFRDLSYRRAKARGCGDTGARPVRRRSARFPPCTVRAGRDGTGERLLVRGERQGTPTPKSRHRPAARRSARATPKIWGDCRSRADRADTTRRSGAPQVWASGDTGEGVTGALLDTGIGRGPAQTSPAHRDTSVFVPTGHR